MRDSYTSEIKNSKTITLYPAKLRGGVMAPPSKSIAHRAIICAGLARGTSHIAPIENSKDMQATINGMAALSSQIINNNNNNNALCITGGQASKDIPPEIHCFESGSTLRFFIPLVLALSGGGKLTGVKRLMERPLSPYEKICEGQGIPWQRKKENGLHCIAVTGRLKPGQYELPGNISSQFVTGLMLALPLLSGNSEINITTPLESRGYVNITQQVMAAFGVKININNNKITIPGNQIYQASDYRIEGDYSQAAVFLCAHALGQAVTVRGLTEASMQGDREILSILKARAQANADHKIIIDGSQCPDILPMVALTLALTKGESEIQNAGRLRLKECDRLYATVNELRSLGANINIMGDAMIIQGRDILEGGVTVHSHNDHRMAMMLSIAALYCREPIMLTQPEAVAKSWPNYWDIYAQLGGKIV